MTEQMQTPSSVPAATKNNNGFAMASLVLGIISLCASGAWWCGGPISVLGLVFGALGLRTTGRGMAIAGMILSAIGLVLLVIIRVVFRSLILDNLVQRFLTSRGY